MGWGTGPGKKGKRHQPRLEAARSAASRECTRQPQLVPLASPQAEVVRSLWRSPKNQVGLIILDSLICDLI